MHVVLVTYSDWLPDLAMYDVAIAVDSGIKQFALANQHCHYWIGDFDSVEQKQNYDQFATEIIELPRIKDVTDTQAALEFAQLHLQATKVTIVTTHSGRFDHQYAQVLLCQWGLKNGVEVTICSRTSLIQLLQPGQYQIPPGDYKYLSVFAWQKTVHELTITDVAYPLHHATLTYGNPLGISNEINGSSARIQFTSGQLLLVQSRD